MRCGCQNVAPSRRAIAPVVAVRLQRASPVEWYLLTREDWGIKMRDSTVAEVARGAAFVVLASLASGAVQAADLPRKAPIYKAPPAAIYNWTGFYVGGGL